MPEPAQRFLEYVFLALLYLFFIRVVRAVWVEVKEPRLVPAAPEPPAPPAPRRDGPRRKGGRGGPFKLVVASPQPGPAFPLDEELTIGRSPGCAIALPEDNFVSQLHARVFRRDDEHWVEDLGSTNGTLLNGRRLSAATPLRKGDRLQVGRTVLEVTR
ncbi:MAG TPA: FHA domain-containing protein [Acidimicrobiales bacterium]|nr:FHA domain-containing protein [Acidimicrobiales bacterium]